MSLVEFKRLRFVGFSRVDTKQILGKSWLPTGRDQEPWRSLRDITPECVIERRQKVKCKEMQAARHHDDGGAEWWCPACLMFSSTTRHINHQQQLALPDLETCPSMLVFRLCLSDICDFDS